MILIIDEKKKLRARLKSERKKITTELQFMHAQNMSTKLINTPLFMNSEHIGFYFANSALAEIDTRFILTKALTVKKRCYMPVLNENNTYTLSFAKIQAQSDYMKNKYNILEPISTNFIVPEELDLVLVPLLGYDKNKNRLGMGAGYYDKTFAFKKKGQLKPILVGIAYSMQLCGQVPTEKHDLALDFIVNELEMF